MKKIILTVSILSVLVFSIYSCKKDKKEEGPSDSLKKAAIQNYSAIVYASYVDALYSAQQMRIKINDFVANPNEATMLAAQSGWLVARHSYCQTEAYRFYNGPIDNSANGPEPELNSWPLDENFIDYTVDQPTAGIISDTVDFPTIYESMIDSMNTNGGEANISDGYHAVEFLLWGQDLSAVYAGQRPYTDYTPAKSNYLRRGQYLKDCADLIVQHLQWLVDQWDPYATNNYRASFVNGDANAAIANILQGCGTMAYGELAGERMEVAWETQSQEQEHDCFSDNTTNDYQMNILGIQNVYLGKFKKADGTVISGTGMYDIVKAANAATADSVKAAIANAVTAVYDIQPPFDQQILQSNPVGYQDVHEAILAVKNAGDQIAVAANKLGLQITITE